MNTPADSTPPADTPPRPVRHSGVASSGREDCWSEAATAVLIEAWGERHLRCNRGNLRQTDWREVADAVNGRSSEDASSNKPRKSDVQCKNRIDTLKKKYKVEKARSAPSTWPFFNRLDHLIGPAASAGKSPARQRPSRFRSISNPNLSKPNPRSGAITVFSGGSLNSVDSSDSESSMGGIGIGRDLAVSVGRKRSRLDEFEDEETEAGAFKELANAILKFGEIYEKIEESKQRQMVELERQRMEFTKELEFQRMNMLMEAQLEIEKVKRSKNASNSGETSNKL